MLFIRMKFDSKNKKKKKGGWILKDEPLWLLSLTLFWGIWTDSSIPAHYLTYDCLVRILQNHAKDRRGGCVEFHVCRPGETEIFSIAVKPRDGVYGLTVSECPQSSVLESPSPDDFSGLSVLETPSLRDFQEPASLEDADTTALLGGEDGKEKKRRRGLRFLGK